MHGTIAQVQPGDCPGTHVTDTYTTPDTGAAEGRAQTFALVKPWSRGVSAASSPAALSRSLFFLISAAVV